MTARMILFEDGRAHFLLFDSSPEIENRRPTFLCIIFAVLSEILSELKKKSSNYSYSPFKMFCLVSFKSVCHSFKLEAVKVLLSVY